ncbi:VRR-NUC domain-containing protein [Microbacterium sp. G2-8]|uniref:VRR-NUC domain-containing protein n=1 Tax=Microbacterium sp. G2-8 TaxID=2842454 RepID=UPI001C8AB5FF|nr:VRR-NUC domain-containing protein [Microbacterium sp. G2-8]
MAGAPAGRVDCFTEVSFELHGTKKSVRPDGLIRVTRGKRTWVALVEVKTGRNRLDPDQLNNYLDVAREHGFDALITISNEISPNADKHPTDGVDGRKLRRLTLHHWSWSRLLTVAVMEKEHRGVRDPDQAWVLGELIRYLEHPKSGALAFEDMGDNWTTVRDSVRTSTLRTSDKEPIAEITANFDALMRFTSLRAGRRLGVDVKHQLTRKESQDPAFRQQTLARELVDQGSLSGVIRIPGTVGDIVITADLRSRTVTCAVDIDAPKSGRNRTRINWLVRQLREARGDTRIEAYVPHQRGQGAANLLDDARETPDVLIIDPAREIVRFRVAAMTKMGTKRGVGSGCFIDSVLEAFDTFYADVVQNLSDWVAPPPKAPTAAKEEPPTVTTEEVVADAE